MRVILKKDLVNLGKIGEVVQVKPGYARNYLIPRNLASTADSKNVKALGHQKRIVDGIKKKARVESESVAEKLKAVTIKIERRANESGKMFGSITLSDLSSEFVKLGYNFHRRDIEVEAIKEGGEHAIKVRLPGDVFVNVKLLVSLELEKAKPEKKKKVTKATKTSEEEGASESLAAPQEASAAETSEE